MFVLCYDFFRVCFVFRIGVLVFVSIYTKHEVFIFSVTTLFYTFRPFYHQFPNPTTMSKRSITLTNLLVWVNEVFPNLSRLYEQNLFCFISSNNIEKWIIYLINIDFYDIELLNRISIFIFYIGEAFGTCEMPKICHLTAGAYCP